MFRVVCMALMNTIPVVTTIFGAAYAVQAGLRHRLPQGRLPLDPRARATSSPCVVIPFVGNLSDRIGRRPPIIVGALGSGLLVLRLPLRDLASTACRSRSSCRC